MPHPGDKTGGPQDIADQAVERGLKQENGNIVDELKKAAIESRYSILTPPQRGLGDYTETAIKNALRKAKVETCDGRGNPENLIRLTAAAESLVADYGFDRKALGLPETQQQQVQSEPVQERGAEQGRQ